MTITVNTKAYNLDAVVDSNQVQYNGPNHNLAGKDVLSLRRQRSGASAVRPATVRVVSKFTRTLTNVLTGEKFDVISERTVLLPEWAVEADVNSIRDDHGDLLISANGADLDWKLDINQ